MNTVEQLIDELCPDGVEFRALGDYLQRTKGTPITAKKMSVLNKEGAPIKIFAGGKTIAYVDYGDIPEKDVHCHESVVVKSRGIIGFEYINKPFSHKNEFWSYNSNTPNINIKYVYYYLKNSESYFQVLGRRMSKMPQLSIPDTDKYPIPIPPLEIQEEIVRILDNFTQLETELETELEARKKQYEYYRDELLTFGEDVERKTLGEVGSLIRGNGLQKKDFVEKGVGCIHYGQIYTYYGAFADKTITFVTHELAKKLKKAHKGDVLLAGVSENIEDICKPLAWLGDEICISGDMFAFRHNQNTKFITYLLQTHNFQKYKKRYAQGAKVTRVKSNRILDYKIPIPPLTEQKRIVAILDKFDALVNDISTGLPAEIAARRKQYEYYRNKLLTFKPLEAADAN